MQDLYQALDAMLEVVEARSIDYALTGGLAVRCYAIPRSTVDVDMTVAITEAELIPFLDDLRDRGFTIPDAYYQSWLDRVQGMPVLKARPFGLVTDEVA